ncbi:polysaccharide deacetylase family protein [Chitinophagaceae bacterium MMS25-I14]
MAWVKMPALVKFFFSKELVWRMPADGRPAVYLTFDDGPHPVATPYVLDQLAKYNAKATFFCIGKNVAEYPEIYERILAEGHAVGNHTHNHKNGWKTDTDEYIQNIVQATKYIKSFLFRPPYGRIKRTQVNFLTESKTPWKIIMWDVLSMDYDREVTPEQCLKNVVTHTQPGSIIVFHDSEKAWDRMSYTLPRVLQFCKEKGWECLPIS